MDTLSAMGSGTLSLFFLLRNSVQMTGGPFFGSRQLQIGICLSLKKRTASASFRGASGENMRGVRGGVKIRQKKRRLRDSRSCVVKSVGRVSRLCGPSGVEDQSVRLSPCSLDARQCWVGPGAFHSRDARGTGNRQDAMGDDSFSPRPFYLLSLC